MKKMLCAVLLGLFACIPVRMNAQEPVAGACSTPMSYENHNQIDPKPPRLNIVEGHAYGPEGAEVWNVCLGLFSEKDHTLVAAIPAGHDGFFSFPKISAGRYRLVARSLGFCSANVPLL